MKVRILGAAAGGGLPQWNCRCPNCLAVRAGDPDIQARTQSSVAVSRDGRAWVLLNLSPDIHRQIASTPELLPAGPGVRGTAICGCILTDAEIDHTSGLLLTREGGSFGVMSTPTVRRWLNRQFSLESTLSSFAVRPWHELTPGEGVDLERVSEALSGLTVEAIVLDAHAPRYVELEAGESPAGSVIALRIVEAGTGKSMLYAPCVASVTPELAAAAAGTDLVLLDGTFWTDDELIDLGISDRSAREMGHLPVGGAGGSLEWMGELKARHRVYVHINNTNPMLNRGSAEYHAVVERGVIVGADGDQFEVRSPGIP